MIAIWLKTASLFDSAERRNFMFLFLCSVLLGVFEMIGIASIMPFVAVLTNPEMIETHANFSLIYDFFGFESQKSFVVALGLLVFVMLTLSNLFDVIYCWLNARFVNINSYKLSKSLLRTYVNHNFVKAKKRNTSELSKNILEDVERVVDGIMMAGMDVVNSLISAVLVIFLLLWVNPWVTLTVALVFGCFYTLIFQVLRSRISKLGGEVRQQYSQMYQHTQQALDGLKEIKAYNREADFIQRYSTPRKASALNSIRYDTMELIPTHSLEVMAFGTVIAVSLFFVLAESGSEWGYSIVALFVFSAYRILPMIKGAFDGMESMEYYRSFLEGLWDDLSQTHPTEPSPLPKSSCSCIESIEMKDIEFSYDPKKQLTLDKVSLKFSAGERLCLVGTSGAGKTTLIDVLLGLLHPSAGEVRANGVAVSADAFHDIRDRIGYVSQDPYLLDDTLANNILFGRSLDNPERLYRAFELAELADVFQVSHKEAVNIPIGQGGAALSGGQKQRIAIARALYREPDILILDESTNGLDLVTEQHLLAKLESLPSVTLLFVSHRPAVMKFCQRLVVVEQGKVVADSRYDDLVKQPRFRALLE